MLNIIRDVKDFVSQVESWQIIKMPTVCNPVVKSFEAKNNLSGLGLSQDYRHIEGLTPFDITKFSWATVEIEIYGQNAVKTGMYFPSVLNRNKNAVEFFSQVPDDNWDAYESAILDIFQKLWQEYVRLNPPLEAIEVDQDNLTSIRDALDWVLSGLSVDEMLERRRESNTSQNETEGDKALLKYIDDNTEGLCWKPSRKMMKIIKLQIDSRKSHRHVRNKNTIRR